MSAAQLTMRNPMHQVLLDFNRMNEYFVENNEKSKLIVCYCDRGVSSRIACKHLMKAGFENVWNLKGGYAAWQNESGDTAQT